MNNKDSSWEIPGRENQETNSLRGTIDGLFQGGCFMQDTRE